MRQMMVCSIEFGSFSPEITCKTEKIWLPDEPIEEPKIMAAKRTTSRRHETQMIRDMIEGVLAVTG
jgi:hypothetical protein